MLDTEQLRELVGGHQEWLRVRDAGNTFPLEKHEIEIDDAKALFGFLDDQGFHSWRLNSFAVESGEITIDVAGESAKKRETMRLVPRTSPSVLTGEIELARLAKANEIAEIIASNFPGTKLGRVALNVETGRFAQINFDTADKTPMAAIADVTGTLTVESIFTAAMLWLEKLGQRKKPVLDIWIVGGKRQAKHAQKLHALLSERWKGKITVLEIIRKDDPIRLASLPKRKVRDLWREKAAKLSFFPYSGPSELCGRILDL